MSRVLEGLKQDLSEAFPEIVTDTGISVWDILKQVFRKAGKKFVFVIDEWDSIFHMSFITADFFKRIRETGFYETGIEVEEGSAIVFLVTCSYQEREGRLVVAGIEY